MILWGIIRLGTFLSNKIWQNSNSTTQICQAIICFFLSQLFFSLIRSQIPGFAQGYVGHGKFWSDRSIWHRIYPSGRILCCNYIRTTGRVSLLLHFASMDDRRSHSWVIFCRPFKLRDGLLPANIQGNIFLSLGISPHTWPHNIGRYHIRLKLLLGPNLQPSYLHQH